MSLETQRDAPWQLLGPVRDEIRILEVSPALSPTDSIICHLQTVSLHDQPEYEALSYVWGDSSDSRQILLDGNELSVTDSLFEALKHLRDVKKTRILWVDALCINQKDDNEKNIQVMMMGKIYSQAIRVLIWLSGSEMPELLDEIVSISQNPKRHFTELPLAFLTLPNINWWHRAWTFQEAVLAKNLIFHTGHKYFTLEDLEGCCVSLHHHLFGANGCCGVIYEKSMRDVEFISAYTMVLQILNHRRQEKRSLLDIIVDNRDRIATKPQDKVYAYLGLAHNLPPELVKYELSLRDWVLHVSAKLIQHDESLKIVRYAKPSGDFSVDKQRMDGLPSWCPDWTQTFKKDSSFFQIKQQYDYYNYKNFTASGRTTANSWFPTPDILGVSGILCDTVTHVGQDSSNIEFGPGADSKTLRQWCHLVANSTSVHNARCNECDKIIYGVRNRCFACSDFDLCSRCFSKSGKKHPDHWFTSIQSNSLESQDDSCNPDLYEPSEIVITEHENGYIVKGSSWERLSDIAYPFSDGDTMQDAFRKVLTADIHFGILSRENSDINDNSQEASIFKKIAFAKYWNLVVERRPEAAFIMKEGYPVEPGSVAFRALAENSIRRVLSTVRRMVWRMKLFVSSKGYIGWGPRTMKAGDTIAVLYGSNMPFVLRALPEQPTGVGSGSGYTMVGECYVHGLMNGEALENAEMEKRDFLLY